VNKITYGLIGEHLSHSVSKEIHHALTQGAYDYRLIELSREEVGAFLQKRDFRGLNVTIPYKKTVMPYCDCLTDQAQRIGSVNTIYWDENGRLCGDNTDYAGLCYLIQRAGICIEDRKVLVLGNGGAGLTAITAAQNLGARQVVSMSRSGEVTYDQIEDHLDSEVIINATPVGMYPNNGQRLIDLQRFAHCEGVVDMVYNPLKTALLLQAEELGIVVLATEHTTYTTSGLMYQAGIRGTSTRTGA